MKEKDIINALRSILGKDDIDRDSPVTRKKSCRHISEIELLLSHVQILIADLRHDAESSRRELFEVRDILESEI